MSAGQLNNCVFCDLNLTRIIHRDDLITVFWDGYPVSPGYALIIPNRHVVSGEDLKDGECGALVAGIAHAKKAITAEHSPDGYNIGINDGVAAGQTVMHLHVHIIPRYTGDSADPRGGIRLIFPDKTRYWEQ